MTGLVHRISRYEFAHGIFCVISQRATAPGRSDLLHNWLLDSSNAHQAAAAAYQYLRLRPDCELPFAIYLDPTYEDSNDWYEAVAFEHDLGCLVVRGRNGGLRSKWYSIEPWNLDMMLVVGYPGSAEYELWQDCAWVFMNAYGRL